MKTQPLNSTSNSLNQPPFLLQVGIGIIGHEGMQAVRASDYALGRFHFLSKLVLVHGRANYRRLCYVVLYSFYKNLVSQWISFLFSWENLFTGTALFETLLGTGFNVAFTFLPIIVYGIWDEDLAPSIVKRCGFLYSIGQRNGYFDQGQMIRNMMWATMHGLCIYYFTKWSFFEVWSSSPGSDVVTGDGHSSSMYAFGTVVYGVMIILLNVSVAVKSYTWSGSLLGSLGMSVFLYFLFVITHSSYYAIWKPIAFGYDYFGIGIHLFGSPRYWLTLVGVSVLCLLPDMLYAAFGKEFFELSELETLCEVVTFSPQSLEQAVANLARERGGDHESYSTGLERLGKLVQMRQSTSGTSRKDGAVISTAISTGHRRLMDRLFELQGVISATNKGGGGKGLQASSMKSHIHTYIDPITLKYAHHLTTLEKEYVRRYVRLNIPVMKKLFAIIWFCSALPAINGVMGAIRNPDRIVFQALGLQLAIVILFLPAYYLMNTDLYKRHYQNSTSFLIGALSVTGCCLPSLSRCSASVSGFSSRLRWLAPPSCSSYYSSSPSAYTQTKTPGAQIGSFFCKMCFGETSSTSTTTILCTFS